MLSDYLFAGVVVGAAVLSLGLLARALPAGSASPLDERRGLMVLLAVLVEGLGVLAITYGMLVMFADTSGAAGTAAALAILLPVAAAAVPGVVWSRPGQREGVRASMAIMLAFIGALLALAGIVALLAWLVSDIDASGLDTLTLLAAAVMATGALGIGLVGSRGLREAAGVVVGRPTVDVATVGWTESASSNSTTVGCRSVVMAAVLEGVAIVAYVVAMMMFLMRD
jgi:hypothetical protein